MNILVLNGSPKGDNSITLQTVLYFRKLHPEHEYVILNVGQKIRTFEKDFSEAAAKIAAADLILFSYPVYTFIVPAQLHRFIELMKEDGADCSGKLYTQVTTSKHFYDVTAHRFIDENCADLGMKRLRGFSADMDDLLNKKGRKQAADFWDHLLWSIDRKEVPADPDREIVVVADLAEGDDVLKGMIDSFRAKISAKVRVVNIHEFPFSGGCLSCFNCSTDGTCIYKDGFDKMLREQIQTGDAIVIAFTIRDHSMGSLFKMYDDRQFCNGHRTVTMGMPFGYLINGDIDAEQNLKMIIEARAEVGGNYLAAIAGPDESSIDDLAAELSYAVANRYRQPANFFGVGGMKIFRDLIWQMQGMMKADHRFFKSHGQYDFPQKNLGTVIKMYLVGALLSNKKLKAKMGNRMTEGMLAPYKKALEEDPE